MAGIVTASLDGDIMKFAYEAPCGTRCGEFMRIYDIHAENPIVWLKHEMGVNAVKKSITLYEDLVRA